MSAETDTKTDTIADRLRDPEKRWGTVLRGVGLLLAVAGAAYLAEKRADAKYERGVKAGLRLAQESEFGDGDE